ncbi:MAG: hypothetical protein J6I64_09340 [Lachnospiraceae bacterium]|nr:hypothetical protein [Lachnospiraceae bacterium]
MDPGSMDTQRVRKRIARKWGQAEEDQEILVEHVEYRPSFYRVEKAEQVSAAVFYQNTLLEPPTEEEIDDFYEMLKNACGMSGFNDFIWNIVSEESGAYFAGDKTAREVADLIQNRVSLYVSENR